MLVGGFGTRLKPLTNTQPKHTLPIADQPMLEHIMAWLCRQTSAGSPLITEAVLSLGYKPDAIERSYPEGVCAELPFSCAVEPEPLGTAGGLAFGAAHAQLNETFLAMNGDILCDFDCEQLLAVHQRNQAAATIALTEVADASRFGVVETDSDGQVLRFVEKPQPQETTSRWINAGIYILEPEALAGVEPGRNVSIEREVFPELAAQGRLSAHQFRGSWLDAGTPEAFLQAQFLQAGLNEGDTSNYVHPQAVVSEAATASHSVIMSQVEVQPEATVERSALLPGCVVEAGASVRDSIIGPGAVVGSQAQVETLSVVAANVAPGERLDAARHG